MPLQGKKTPGSSYQRRHSESKGSEGLPRFIGYSNGTDLKLKWVHSAACGSFLPCSVRKSMPLQGKKLLQAAAYGIIQFA